MKPQHHIPQTMLLNYMGAQLSPDFSYVVSSHVSNCQACSEKAAQLLAIGGEALDALSPTKMEVSAKDILQTLGSPNEGESISVSKLVKAPIIPTKTELFDEDILRGLKYQKLGPGVRQHIFKLGNRKTSATSARILWIDAGVAVPSHGHGGTELTQVLVGGFYDGKLEFTKGDVQVVKHIAPHQPLAMDDGPCMVLAVAQTPLKFQNILPKLLQPLFRI